MDTLSVQPPKYKLNDKWNLYYHLPHNNNWDLKSYTVILGGIHYAEEVICLNKAINDGIIRQCMLFLMRDGITPMWEDPKNREGGCFSFKVINKIVPDVWKTLVFLLCGESLAVNKEHCKHINGITVSPKKNFCIIKVWMDTTAYKDPSMLVTIPNLLAEGCLFKKHDPEY